MNIEDCSAIRDCTSCQMCGAACPVQAISIELNSDGFYRPKVDLDKCIDCSLCVKCCYKFDSNLSVTTSADDYQLLSAKCKQKDILQNTTSGGIADLLAKSLIDAGFICIGVAYDCSQNIAVGKLAENKHDVNQFRGSKYIQSYSLEAFKYLVAECKNKKFAIFGLPCQIYAVNKFLSLRGCREKHLLIDLFCHGVPSINLWSKYLSDKHPKDKKGSINNVNFRSKLRGWGNYTISIDYSSDNKEVRYISPRVNDPFFTLFFSDLLLNDSCASCAFRGSLEYADIRLGDFWGKKFIADKSGVSGIVIMSGNGQKAISAIQQECVMNPEPVLPFLKTQNFGKVYNIDNCKRNLLLKMIADPNVSIKSAAHKYLSLLDRKRKIKRILKNIVLQLPDPLITFIRAHK